MLTARGGGDCLRNGRRLRNGDGGCLSHGCSRSDADSYCCAGRCGHPEGTRIWLRTEEFRRRCCGRNSLRGSDCLGCSHRMGACCGVSNRARAGAGCGSSRPADLQRDDRSGAFVGVLQPSLERDAYRRREGSADAQ